MQESKIGKISGTLTFVGLPFAVFSTFTAGYLYDILGRRITLFIAFFCGSILLASIPHTAPSVFPSLIIVRALL